MIKVWRPTNPSSHDEDNNLISKEAPLIRELDYSHLSSTTKVLYLNDNHLTALNLSLLPVSLKRLYCSYNQISRIIGTPHKNLEYIDVSFNNLTEVPLFETCKINLIGNPIAQSYYKIKTFKVSEDDIFITLKKGTPIYLLIDTSSSKEFLLSPYFEDQEYKVLHLKKSKKVLLGTNPTFYDQKDMKKVEDLARHYGLDGYICNSEHTHIGVNLSNLEMIKKCFLIQTKDFYSIPKLVLF